MTRTQTGTGAPPEPVQRRDADDVLEFSPLSNEPLLRWQRMIGVAPRHGLGILRRAVILTLVAWLPLAIWALWAGRFWQESSGESLLQHFAVNSRFLLGIPLLIAGEALLHSTLSQLTRKLGDDGFIADSQRGDYRQILHSMMRWRDAALPPLLMVLVVMIWSVLDAPDPHADGSAWALLGDGHLGFGAWWGAYVARPIFLILLLAWFWRLLLVTVLFIRIGRLDLQLVPSHPDRMGGLFFLDVLPMAWMLLTLTLSLVISSHWAHLVLYHGHKLVSLKWQATLFVGFWAVLLLLPLFVLAPAMIKTKQRALLTYGDLVGRQGAMVHRRWIEAAPVEDDKGLLDAPEIGPIADAAAMYGAVKAMRLAPVGMRALIFILIPLAIPMLVLVMLEVPLLHVILKLFKAVV